jgi:hypothetical protein
MECAASPTPLGRRARSAWQRPVPRATATRPVGWRSPARPFTSRSLLHESDREKLIADRSRALALNKLRPERVELSIDAKDFLLFGSDLLGMPDAPRGALTAKIDVKGDLSQPRRRIDATVHALNLSMPDRLDKAHWPEKPHLGDVLYLDEKGVEVGKLGARAEDRPGAAAP